MNLSDRIRAARKHAGLTQGELATKAGVSQQAISRLEKGDQKTSTDIVQIAVACRVRPEWLAMEKGEMVDGLYIEDERMKKAVQILQQMPDFAIDEAIANLNSLAQFAEKAAKASKKENG